jgi:undecaprenyl-diphosphatase
MPTPDPKVREELAPAPARSSRAWIFQGFLWASILGFFILALLASTHAYFSIDLAITQNLQTYQAAWFRQLMRGISWPGYTWQSLLIVSGLALALVKLGFQREAFTGCAAAFGSGLLNTLVKLAIQRPRPSTDLVEVARQLSSYSFPSGHVMFYTAFFGFFLFLAYSRLKNSWLRATLILLFGGLVVLVGPSRIYLGEHWASDVLGAYLLGSLVLLGAIQAYQRWGARFPFLNISGR